MNTILLKQIKELRLTMEAAGVNIHDHELFDVMAFIMAGTDEFEGDNLEMLLNYSDIVKIANKYLNIEDFFEEFQRIGNLINYLNKRNKDK